MTSSMAMAPNQPRALHPIPHQVPNCVKCVCEKARDLEASYPCPSEPAPLFPSDNASGKCALLPPLKLPRRLCFSIFIAVIAGHCQVPFFDLPLVISNPVDRHPRSYSTILTCNII